MTLTKTIIAGDTFKHTSVCSEYKSPDYNLKLILQGSDSIIMTGDIINETTFEFTASNTVTKDWLPGKYRYTIYAYSLTEEYSIENGSTTIELRADLLSNTDVRSQNLRTLENIRAVIENRATLDQEEYTINNRSLKRTPLADLIALEKYYTEKVQYEESYGTGYRRMKNKVKVVM